MDECPNPCLDRLNTGYMTGSPLRGQDIHVAGPMQGSYPSLGVLPYLGEGNLKVAGSRLSSNIVNNSTSDRNITGAWLIGDKNHDLKRCHGIKCYIT